MKVNDRPADGHTEPVPGEAAELRELVAGLAADAARIASAIASMDNFMELLFAARRAGYEEGLAVRQRAPRMPRDRSRAGLQMVRSGGTPGGAV